MIDFNNFSSKAMISWGIQFCVSACTCSSKVLLAAVFLAGSLIMGLPAHAQNIVEYESSALSWLADTSGSETYAFDAYYPGLNGKGDLCDPVITLNLGTTDLTIERMGGGGALRDASIYAELSDAPLYINGVVSSRWTFSVPIYNFYTYYGSADSANTFTMELYYADELIGSISRFGGGMGVYAVGHGFSSDVPVDRIDFISSGPDSAVLVGGYIGLYTGEESLGTVYIDGYHGPNGSTVEMDFGYSTVPPVSYDFNLQVGLLIAGNNGSLTVTGANAGTKTFLAYSVKGTGQTRIAYLNVTLGLSAPIQAGQAKYTDAIGTVSWNLPIPVNSKGMDVWFQAVQNGKVSNVAATWIN